MRRVLPVLAVAALLAAALLLANDAAGDSGLGVWYPWMLAACVLALVALLVMIVQRLWRLRGELRKNVPGARLNRRVLLMLIVLALPPVLIVYGFALNFLHATIDNWFNVRTERALGDTGVTDTRSI
jgi:nitrogen fixation/metabolism regulation signal transduction histidine kinase